MTAIFDQNTPMRDAFKLTNNLLAQGIRGVWQMLARPGLVNVDFAYLYSIVRGKSAESAFASAEAAGEMRARDVVEKLVGSPLLDEGQVLVQSTDILVSIVGGADMTIADVNKIMEQLQRRAETANLIMGAAIDDEYEGRICLTVVATRNAHEPVADKPTIGAPRPRGTKPVAEKADAKEQKDPKESEFDTNFLSAASTPRAHSRYAAPPPPSTPENTAELLQRQCGG
jgi:cell division protein FtsZ